MTGRTDLKSEIYIIRGFNAVINKPYLPKNLLATIDSIMNKAQVASTFIENIKEYDSSKIYNFDNLKEFLSNKENALEEILSIFISDTKQNMFNLKNAISDKNIYQVKEVCHKMNPMFKQIQAFEISKMLDKFENQELTLSDIENDYKKLNKKIIELLSLIEQDIF